MDHSIELKNSNARAAQTISKLNFSIPSNLQLSSLSDICNVEAEAIVNSANELLLGGGGMDGAIRSIAGEGLQQECERIPLDSFGVRCYTGKAVLTGAHGLPNAGYIIHTVAPYLDEKDNPQPALLQECYRSCMQLVKDRNISSVAFPSIGTGYYGYPIVEAATIAVTTIVDCMSNIRRDLTVIIVPYSPLDQQVYSKLMYG